MDSLIHNVKNVTVDSISKLDCRFSSYRVCITVHCEDYLGNKSTNEITLFADDPAYLEIPGVKK